MEIIEKESQAQTKDFPRILPADIEANIVTEYYFSAGDAVLMTGYIQGKDTDRCQEGLSVLTFCVLTLKNGFAVTGESACAHPSNFDVEIGRKIARQNAINKIWPLMGYALKSTLSGVSQ